MSGGYSGAYFRRAIARESVTPGAYEARVARTVRLHHGLTVDGEIPEWVCRMSMERLMDGIATSVEGVTRATGITPHRIRFMPDETILVFSTEDDLAQGDAPPVP